MLQEFQESYTQYTYSPFFLYYFGGGGGRLNLSQV